MNEQNNPVVGNVTNPMPQPITPSPEITPVAPVESSVAPVPAPVVEPAPVAPIAPVAPVESSVVPVPAPVVEPASVAPIAPVTDSQVIPGTPVEPVTPDALNTSVETDLSAPVDNTVAPVVMATTNETQAPPQTMSVSDLMAPPPGAPDSAPVQTMTQNNNSTDGVSSEDESFVRAFVGENYDSFKNSKFNVGAFFFPVPYFFYRKMFLYGLLLMVISSVILFVFSSAFYYASFIFDIACGFIANQLYLGFASNKVAEIKARNSGKSVEDIKQICANKGGTSIAGVFFGGCLVIIMGILFVVIVIGGMFAALILGAVKDASSSTNNTSGTPIVNAVISGHTCVNTNCSLILPDDEGNYVTYVIDTDNNNFVANLGKYNNYVNITLYYVDRDSDKVIVGYKLYDKTTNAELVGINSEDALKAKFGIE